MRSLKRITPDLLTRHATRCALLALALSACAPAPPPTAPAAPPRDAPPTSPSSGQGAQDGASAPAQARGAEAKSAEAKSAEASPSPPTSSQGPRFEEAPVMDLLHNRHRWHVHAPGLVIPFDGEGFWKYTQEYRRPFEGVVVHEQERGRLLTQSEATLRVPWRTPAPGQAPDQERAPARATLRAHGLSANQAVHLNVNGKRAGTFKLSASWSESTIEVPAGMLRPGENTLLLKANQHGQAAGKKSWGLYQTLTLSHGPDVALGARQEATPGPGPVRALTRGAQTRQGLGGAQALDLYTELPRDAWLTFEVGSPKAAQVSVELTDEAGQVHTLWEASLHGQDAWLPQRLPLVSHGDQLVRLTLRASDPEVVFASPALRLEASAKGWRPPIQPVKHVVLVVVDALRADRLALYDRKTRVRTPRMTEAGRHAIVYLHNQAAAPSSPPSHGSIQTGMIPRVHGVTGDKGDLIKGTPLLSSQAREAGLQTAYVGNNPFGMRRLREASRWSAYIEPNSMGKGIDCAAVVKETLGFAKAQLEAKGRFLVSALPFEPHTPYRYHEGVSTFYHKGGWGPPVGKSVDGVLLGAISGGKQLTEEQWSQLRALYDGEVEHMDGCFGQLWDGLKALGVLEETAILITSDHGEGMNEHGRMGHAYGHYAELSNVPFILYAPGRIEDGPWSVDVVTSNIDLTPTLLTLLGVAPSPKVQGESVLELARRPEGWTPRAVSMEYGKSYALRARRWKLMVGYDGKEQLYHSATDPLEQKDLLERHMLATRAMRDMTGFFLAHRSAWRASTWGGWADHGPGFVAP